MPNTNHLNEKELILMQIERDILDLKKKTHVADCQICRKRVEELDSSLNKMNKLVSDYAPEPKRIISSNLIKARNVNVVFKPKVLLTGLVLIMLLFLSIPYYLRHNSYIQNTEVVDLLEDPFLSNVDALTENALPVVFLYIQGESNLDFDKAASVFFD